jgi:vacuolar-type H+-ATPase subunit I/STV1
MLMTHRPERQRQIPSGLRRFDWQLFLIAWAAAFHLIIGFTLAVAPYDQIHNAGTAPVLAMGSRYSWALLFVVAGTLSLLVSRNPRPGGLLFAAALVVFPLGAVWLAAFVAAVLQGNGSALSVVIWPFLYGPWCVAMLRVGLGKR